MLEAQIAMIGCVCAVCGVLLVRVQIAVIGCAVCDVLPVRAQFTSEMLRY